MSNFTTCTKLKPLVNHLEGGIIRYLEEKSVNGVFFNKFNVFFFFYFCLIFYAFSYPVRVPTVFINRIIHI